MKWLTPYRAVAVVASLAVYGEPAPQDQPFGAPQAVLRSTTQEVLLDFIARDKHQKLVANLRPADVDVLEDGVPQTLRSFRYRQGRELSGQPGELVGTGQSAIPPAEPLREINLVSLVFEALGAESRREAAQAAKDFLANEVDSNTYVGVFTLNQRLALLQQYTNDTGLLNKAVDRAMTGAYPEFARDIAAEVAKLNSLVAGPGGNFQAIRPGSAEERGPVAADSGPAAFSQVERRMAEMTVEILSNQFGNLSIDALQQLIQVQAQLPGRKTVIYFSPGLIIPPEQPERFRAVVSAANRANITFYTVDPSGLDTASMARLSGLTGRAISNPSAKTNFKENLRGLAEDTGGFAIADTNDARIPLRHVMEEVRAHYEVAYAPTSSNYDGHFRTIEIRARQPGLRLQGRNGYFALPILGGEALVPFEFAALTALNRQPTPHAFDFHAGVLTFHATAESTECRVVFSIHSRALHFASNSNLFHIHVSFLGLVKDEQDQVVRKISRDLFFQAPAGRRAEFERGDVTVTLPLRLPPGRYHLEAVAADREAEAASTARIALVIPVADSERRVGLSDLVLVRSVQPAGEDRDATDPLEFSDGKVTPEMKSTVIKASAAAMSVYFVLYPGPDASPDVRVAISHNGQVLASAQPGLPPAEADGSFRILGRIPIAGLDAGVYEITVTAVQAGSTARRTAAVEVE
jgi:VWFA-related protein